VPRVLLLTSHPVQGRDGADKEISLGLLQNNLDVDYTWVNRAGSRQLAEVGGTRLTIISRRGTPGLLERVQTALLGLLHERRVELVHVVSTIGPGFRSYSRLRAVLGRAGLPVVHTVPGFARPEHLMDARPLGLTVAVSTATQAALVAAGFGAVRCIPSGISLSRWPMAWPEVHPRPVVLFSGHHDPGGGAHEVLAAAAQLEAGGTPIRLVLALRSRGGGREREARFVLEEARRLGLSSVAVHGRVLDMPRLVAGCDILVFPPAQLVGGKADVPLVVLEALATGRPVVVTDLPQFGALAEAVVRVPVAEPGVLAATLAGLLADPVRCAALAQHGRHLVEQEFSAALMATRYRTLYDELLGSAARLR